MPAAPVRGRRAPSSAFTTEHVPILNLSRACPGGRPSSPSAVYAALHAAFIASEARRLDEVLERSAPALFRLAAEPADSARVPEALNQLGVRFIVVRHLPKTYLDGAAFRTEAGPVIALTLRYDRLDHFWFVLAHEAAHIARGDAGVLDAPPERTDRSKDPKERATDALAGGWLIDAKAFQAFRQETADQPTRAQIEAFAERIGRHPSIVVGRMQYLEMITYGQHRWAHTPIRAYLNEWTDPLPKAA